MLSFPNTWSMGEAFASASEAVHCLSTEVVDEV